MSIAAFPDPLAALDSLGAAQTLELLITRIAFPAGRSNGAALARMLHVRRPQAKVLFVAHPDYQADTEGLGEFLPRTVSMPAVVNAAMQLLNPVP